MAELSPDNIAPDAIAWLQRVLAKGEAAPAPAPATAAALFDTPAWPLLLDAALVSTFVPAQLAVHATEGRAQAEADVLALAELVPTDSSHRWRLRAPARREAIGKALGDAGLAGTAPTAALLGRTELGAAIARADTQTRGATGAALRAILRGATFDAEQASVQELDARRLALLWLQGTPGLVLEPVEALDHAIELRRIVERFRRMTGKDKDKDGRFFGRRNDIERLRAYVGEIGPDNFGQRMARGYNTIIRAVTGRKVLAVHGAGGAGKTTLIAYFVLEHVRAARDRFPFVYLDFDRTTISSRAPANLLAEMCVQVAAQFPELAATLGAIRAQALQLADRADAADAERLGPHCYSFRQALDEYFSRSEGLLGGTLPFVLVFDTFELVQANPGGRKELVTFVQNLLGQGPQSLQLGSWPRLRLVISGRRPVEEFLGPTELWEVAELDREGSVALLGAEMADRGCVLNPAQLGRLVDAVVRRTPGADPRGGVRPLRLRLVASALRCDPDVPADTLVADLITEIERDDSAVTRSLIDGILFRRILGHVSDRRVRDPSDPGLVVRYIDPVIIRDHRAGHSTAGSGATGSYPLKTGEENEIFAEFRAQVSLIEDHGTYARHIQDVRREMLPLIRAHRPELFAELHRRAYSYFSERAADPRAAAEAIYHGLWCGAPVEALEALWQSDPPIDPRLDPDEFAPDAPATAYVRARTGRPLESGELAKLPPAVRLDWLASQMPLYLHSRRAEDTLGWVDAVVATDPQLGGRTDLMEGAARLYYRAGRWGTAYHLAETHAWEPVDEYLRALTPISDPYWISLVRLRTRIEAHAQIELRPVLSSNEGTALSAMTDPDARLEIGLNLLLSAREEYTPGLLASKVEKDLAEARSRIEHRSRRLALLISPSSCAGLLSQHIGAMTALPRDPAIIDPVELLTLPFADATERTRLRRALSQLDAQPTVTFDALNDVFLAYQSQVADAAADASPTELPFAALLRYDHEDWNAILAASLEQAFRQKDSASLRAHVARFTQSDARASIEKGALAGRRALAAVAQAGNMLTLAASFGEDRDKTPPDDFPGLCRALTRWHARLASTPDYASRVSG